ncbi:MAG: permease prefix domain 1-containing protein [Patescibacteria group bacterium]|nr:permease prefix domain 1-containing protein [Patescibacteria group bacterium]MDD5716028.1 permease prefix domain 1-containing protein [Patescibacteria group bacterium]
MHEHTTDQLEEQISQWRSFLQHRQAIHATDVAELEDHLREQIARLAKTGLSADEAFLVAVKRLGKLDELSKEFAREHSDRLWKQLVLTSQDTDQPERRNHTDVIAALGFALVAAVLVKLPSLFGLDIDHDTDFYVRNISFFVLPVLAAYFIWKRGASRTTLIPMAVGLAVAAAFANIYPFVSGGSTETLVGLHIPIGLWVAFGMIYAGTRWRETAGRMDFIRYTGELFIYYVLIALGGGVLTGFMAAIFNSIGFDLEPIVGTWIIPCGAAGAVIIGSWLVEAKQSVIENMAPVLTRLFTPLFAIVLVVFLATIALSGHGIDTDRDILIAFDLLLIVVLGLLVYSISARTPQARPGAFDVLQVILLSSALVADAVALWAIVSRISEFGFSPNRVAALGVNVILLVNLLWSVVLYVRFLRGRAVFSQLERWQTNYLLVYLAWSAVVVIVFPPLFGYK